MRREIALALALLLVLTAAVYGRTVGHGFIGYDDPQRVVDNPEVRGGLTWEGFLWAWSTTAHAPYWHPLSWLSHMLDCQLYGLEPAGHHLTNVLLHLVNVLLAFLLLHAMTGRPWAGLLGAGLFALHPVQAGTVSWISARPDLLAASFSLGALLAYVRGARRASVVLFALALLAKPAVLALPVVLLLLDDWPLGRLRAGTQVRRVLDKWPWLVLAAAAVVAVLLDAERVGGIDAAEAVPLPARLANAAVSYLRYLRFLVLPGGFSVHHPHPSLPGGTPWAAWEVGAAVLLLAGFTGVALVTRARWLRTGWLWFVVLVLPVSGVVQVGDQALAERYVYLAALGLFMVAAQAALMLPTRLATGVAAAVLVGLAARSWTEVGVWKDTASLFRHGLARYPQDPVMQYDLGLALERQGDLAGAERHYRESLRVRPRSAQGLNNLGNVLHRQGRVEEARALYERALTLRPGWPLALNNLGNALRSLGRPDEAIARYREALRDPRLRPVVAHALGTVLLRQGRSAEARAVLEPLAREADPPLLATLAAAYLVEGDLGRAEETALRARSLTVDPALRAVLERQLAEIRRQRGG
ncbi:MAG TPA: tetratricopeptide repeat protein [Candidatus Polarisedimenticolaceae bacterium]|nr:tetratricopeptide repeat protein [Candidatus Polarisedimenticolaceae bacterium]